MRRFLLVVTSLLLAATRVGAQTIYSIDGTDGPPTDEETLYVEYINRARADPTAEGVRLRTTTDAEVLSATSMFGSNLTLMAQEFAAIAPTPPVALNGRLLNAARRHSRDQFNHQFQGHVGTDNSTVSTRISDAGYTFSFAAENVYATASSVFYGHAGFEIDWGNNPDGSGMQAGRGHRVNIHSPDVREVGAGVVLGTNGSVGPQVVTQDFGTQLSGATPLLTGVAYYDLSGDNFYSLGEGLGGLNVTVAGASFSAVTAPSGAFTMPLPGNGTYAVRISGLGIDETGSVTVAGGRNVKLDLKRAFATPALAGAAAPTATVAANYALTPVPGATRYEVLAYRRDAATPTEPADDASRVTLAVASGYDAVQTATRAQGTGAFNLRVVSGARSQSITLNRTFFGRAGATVSFLSRLALASSAETAHVQVSTDAGTTWTDVFTQTGTDTNVEAAFVSRALAVPAVEGKLFQVRLLHTFPGGTFFVGGGAIGWYVDDIRLPNCEELTAEAPRNLAASTAFTFTPAAVGNYLLQVVSYNNAHRLGASEPRLLGAPPSIVRTPASAAVAAGASASATAGAVPVGATLEWQRNGRAVSGATSTTFTIASMQPADTGLYRLVTTSGSATITSDPAILGVTAPGKVIGDAREIASDIVHPKGNIYDQILLQGVAASFTADPGQITRLSYVDLHDDIVQVEFSGAGTVSIVLDGASGPAAPAKYNQPGVAYMKGHAGIVVTGANETTNLSVFSVGRGNAVNQALFRSDVTYDGFADIAFIAIDSANGKFGGLRTANASYFAAAGYTGVYAPGVQFTGPVFVGDINATESATPVLMLGAASDVRITGGDLAQANGRAVQVSGITQLKMADGASSHFVDLATTPTLYFPAKTNRARLEQDGVDVTARIVVNP